MTAATTEYDDRAARLRALRVEHNILCTAPAGSGKTELLVQRALACLALCRHPEEALMLTFTTKAALEMRERILKAFAIGAGPMPDAEHAQVTWRLAAAVLERDKALGWGLALNPSRIRAMTIDALNAMLSSLAPVVSGMGGPIGVADRPQAIYRDAVLALFAELDDLAEDSPVRAALFAVLRFAKNRFESLVPVLASMLAKRDQWLHVVAGAAGDGPTISEVLEPVILSRFEQVAQRVHRSLLDRIASAAAEAGHSSSSVWPPVDMGHQEEWRALCSLLVTKQGDLRKRLQAPDGFPPKARHTEAMKENLLALQGLDGIADALSDVAALPTLHDAEAVEGFAEQVRLVLLRLAAHLRLGFMRAGALDFQEVARRALDALDGEDGSSPLLERLDYRFRHILVDEVQDTSHAQYELLSAITAGWAPGDGRSLFLVGDPQQSIYGFRSAEVGLFLQLKQDTRFNELPLQCVTLTRNFRSDKAVVDWGNALFTRIFPAVDDPFNGGVRFNRSESAVGVKGGAVKTHWFRGEPHVEEAEQVVSIVREAITRDPAGSIVVLARYRAHVRETLAALRRAGIQYSCKDIDPLAQTPAVRDVVGLTRALWHEQDRTAWATLLRSPFVGLSYSDLLALTVGRTSGSFIETARARVQSSSLSPDGRARMVCFLQVLDDAMKDRDLSGDLGRLAEAVWHKLGGPACVTGAEAEDVRATFALLRDHLVGGRLGDIQGFLDGLAGLYASAEGGGTVQVMTMHAAKGLEWDTVILVGLWRGERRGEAPLLAFRHTNAGTLMVPAPGPRASGGHERLFDLVHGMNRDAERRELLRLLYVACTRSVKQLHIICAVAGSDKQAPQTGSLLNVLWPALAADYATANLRPSLVKAADTDLRCPTTQRLPTTWTYPEIRESYVPPRTKALVPSEMAVRGEIGGEDRSVGVFERLVGISYHEAMALLTERDNVNRFEQLRATIQNPMRASMRRRGMPEPRVDAGIERVLTLLDRTLASADGRWILQGRADSGNEYRMSGYLDGEWVTGSIDRYFVDGETWIVDYKSGGHGLTGGALDRYIGEECVRYKPQLDIYERMLAQLKPGAMRRGLFFPEAGRLERV